MTHSHKQLWMQLANEHDLQKQYDVLAARYSERASAIHLARFAEAHIYNAADRHIERLDKRIKELEAELIEARTQLSATAAVWDDDLIKHLSFHAPEPEPPLPDPPDDWDEDDEDRPHYDTPGGY